MWTTLACFSVRLPSGKWHRFLRSLGGRQSAAPRSRRSDGKTLPSVRHTSSQEATAGGIPSPWVSGLTPKLWARPRLFPHTWKLRLAGCGQCPCPLWSQVLEPSRRSVHTVQSQQGPQTSSVPTFHDIPAREHHAAGMPPGAGGSLPPQTALTVTERQPRSPMSSAGQAAACVPCHLWSRRQPRDV